MPKIIDLTNQVFGRWTVVNLINDDSKDKKWNCICSCGSSGIISGGSLRSGRSKSCGCLMVELQTVPGRVINGKSSPTYNSWSNMIGRCTRPSQPDYESYGGRGISVCDEWKESFTKFREDMGDRPEGKTIDRIEVNGNYEPGNCQWSTNIEQQNNKTTSVKVPYNGEMLTIKELSLKTNISEGALWSRKQNGVPLEQLVNTPARYNINIERQKVVQDLSKTIKNMSEISRQTGIPLLSVRKYLGK